jgi:glycine cleavage system aminomethyltransferase T
MTTFAAPPALRAKMENFGGWDMPVEYPCPGGGLIAAHMAVSTGVGLSSWRPQRSKEYS